MPTLLLIRHGDNEFIARNKLAGRLPGVHLNEKGRQQAEVLAQLLLKAPLRAIYSSPMERAVETAQPLAAALGLEVQIRPQLIELNYGNWQGRTFKQLARIKLWKEVQNNPVGVRFPGGETAGQVVSPPASCRSPVGSRPRDRRGQRPRPRRGRWCR